MARLNVLKSRVAYSVVATTLACSSVSEGAIKVFQSSATAGANWSDGNNWVGGLPPVDGDSLEFRPPVAGGTRTTVNDITNLLVTGITAPGSAFVLNGNGVRMDGDLALTGGTNTILSVAIPMALQRDININVPQTTTQVPVMTISGDISGAFGITKIGGGTVNIEGTGKTFTGDTRISGGKINQRLAPIYGGTVRGNIIIDAGASLDSNNLNFSSNALSGAGNVSKFGSNGRTYTLGIGNGSGNHSGALNFSGGSSGILKEGTGTQVFSGTGTLSGGLNANNGSLLIDGNYSAVNSSIAAAATLGGTGTLAAVTVNGALKPGGTLASNVTSDSTAVLNTGALTLTGTAVTTLDILGLAREAQYDGVDVAATSTLTYGGTLNINLAPGLLGAFDLFNAVLTAGNFAAVNINGSPLTNTAGLWEGNSNGTSYVFSQQTGDLVVAVPEPTTLGLLAGASIVGLRRRRSAR